MIAAEAAAAHWQGRLLRCVGNRENVVYQMQTPQGLAALRLHRQGYQGAAAIRAEIWWTGALAAAGVPVPTPLPAQDGARLVTLDDGRHASAVRWLEGEPLGTAGVPFAQPLPVVLARHRRLGQLVAQVHAATDRLTFPTDWPRPTWDREGLAGETPVWGRFWEHPAATAAERDGLRAARDLLRERLGGPVAPVHADVLRENVLVDGDHLSLIDFDDSGRGYRLYDLGTVLSQNLYEPAYPAIRDALAEGYGTTDVATVELMTLARCCASVGWTMPRLPADSPIHRRHIARALMWAAHLAGPGR